MNDLEIPHLIFRWAHVLSAVMWIGQIWSLVVVLRLTPDRPTDSAIAPVLLRAHKWMRTSAGLTWITGLPLLGIVYYGGGALTTPDQSKGLAMGIGFTSLFLGWFVYDMVWRLLDRHQALAAVISLTLLGGVAVWLGRIMTGRAVLVHIGAMLATIMLVNVQERIWPVESRRLSPTTPTTRQSRFSPALAAQRLRHNAGLAIAVLLFMVSNHFPLIYGHRRAWAIPPVIVGSIWLASRFVSVRVPSRTPLHA
jgi:uncharacterized membrane protein